MCLLDISGTGVSPTSYQFSATEQYKELDILHKHTPSNDHSDAGKIPGMFFVYDLSPFMVEVTESSLGFAHLLTNLCAIVGGVFTIAGIIDSVLYHGQGMMRRRDKRAPKRNDRYRPSRSAELIIARTLSTKVWPFFLSKKAGSGIHRGQPDYQDITFRFFV